MSPSRNAERAPFLRLRFSSLLALAFLGLAAIALAYVGGVMTGRASADAERRLAAVTLGRAAPEPPVAEGAKATAPAQEGGGILAPEELRFARALRNEDGAQATVASAPLPVAPQTPAGSTPVAGQLPGQSPVPTPGQSARSPAGEGGPQPGIQAQAQATAQPGSMQDYVFQMGAFRDEDSVDSLRQRLEGRGLRTQMQREGKLYVVLVLLRGDAARAEEVMRVAEDLRLGKPLIKSRKPVSP